MKYVLADLVEQISERENNPSSSEYERFVGLEHYESGKVEITKYGDTSKLDSAMKVFHSGDILVARRNVYLRRAGVVFFDGLTSGDSIVLRAKDKRLERIIPFVLNTDDFWDYADKHSDGTMSKRLSPKMLLQYSFEIDDSTDIDKISELLWATAELEKNYENLLVKTDDLKKSQFISMFGSAADNVKGWPIMTMKEAAIRLSDGPFGSNLKSEHYRSEGVRVIRLQNICDGYFLDDDKAYVGFDHYEKIKKYTCHAGDIVIGTLGDPNLRACIIPDYIDIAINKADCVHYIPREDLLDKKFVCAFLNSPATLKMAVGEAHGNTRQRISSGQVAKLPIIIPPMKLQKEYASFEDQNTKAKASLQRSIETLRLTRRAILMDSFCNGKE